MIKIPEIMNRVIVDFKKLNSEILALLVDKFPNGYDSDHIVVFRNARNEVIEAVEVITEETIYLVKVSQRLADTMENYEEDDDNDFDDGNDLEVAPEEAPELDDDNF